MTQFLYLSHLRYLSHHQDFPQVLEALSCGLHHYLSATTFRLAVRALRVRSVSPRRPLNTLASAATAAMATNSARGNPSELPIISPSFPIHHANLSSSHQVAASEGLDTNTNTPPQIPADAKKEIINSTQTGSSGAHAAGKDAGAADTDATAPKVKTEKECEHPPKHHLYIRHSMFNGLTNVFSGEGAQTC